MRYMIVGIVALVACSWSAAMLRGEEAVIRSAQDGRWSAAETWIGGKTPGVGAKVFISAGHTVIYDVASDAIVRGINVAGVLRFDRNRDTRLNVGLLKIQSGDQYSEEGFDCDHPTTDDPQ
jgi:hypothetical protein